MPKNTVEVVELKLLPLLRPGGSNYQPGVEGFYKERSDCLLNIQKYVVFNSILSRCTTIFCISKGGFKDFDANGLRVGRAMQGRARRVWG